MTTTPYSIYIQGNNNDSYVILDSINSKIYSQISPENHKNNDEKNINRNTIFEKKKS